MSDFSKAPAWSPKQLEILEMLRKHKAVKAATAIQPVDRRNHTQRTDSIELTPNGTMNSKALPFPDSYLTRAYEPPQDGIGKALAIIWRELLKLDQVGRYDNFFSLGGDSLMAIRVVMRLRQDLNVDVAIGDVFLHPVLTDLALLLRSAARVELPAITPVGTDVAVSEPSVPTTIEPYIPLLPP